MDNALNNQDFTDLKPGNHLCCIYETEEEHRAVITPFLRRGLEKGEKVLYIVDSRTAETILEYLREDGMDVESFLSKGQLVILTSDEAYMREAAFDPDAMIALLRSETEKALDEGYSALRVTGEMTWALKGLPGSEKLMEYEAKLNKFFPGSQCMAICQYDMRRFDPLVLLDVLNTHPIAVIGTEIFDNFYYMPPEDFLGPEPAGTRLRIRLRNLAERKRIDNTLEKGKSRFGLIVQNTVDGMTVVDEKGIIRFVNPAAEALFNRKTEELVGELFDFPTVAGETTEFDIISKDGGTSVVEMRVVKMILENRTRYLASLRDITERKRSEDKISHLNNVIRDIRNVNQLITKEKDPDLLIQGVCENLVKTRGFSSAWIVLIDDLGKIIRTADAGLGEAFRKLGEDLEKGNFPVCARKALAQSEGLIIKDPLTGCGDCPLASSCKGNSRVSVKLECEGKTYGILSTSILKDFFWEKEEKELFEELGEDIAFALYNMERGKEQKKAEEALLKAESMYRLHFENVSDIIYSLDPELKLINISPSVEKVLGYKPEELIGRPFQEQNLIVPEYLEQAASDTMRVLGGEHISPAEYQFIARDGTKKWGEVSAAPLVRDGRVVAVISVARDITDRKESEKALKEANDIINKSSSVAFTWKNQEGWPVEFVSENVERLFGYTAEEFITAEVNYAGCVHPEDIERVAKEVAEFTSKAETTEFIHEPYRIIAKDGSEKIINDWTYIVRDNDGRITHYKGIVEDITENKRAEEEREKLQFQLQQAQKMEAIGTLAGGIAHDFNNILGVIIGYTEIADLQVPGNNKAKESLKEVLKAGRRARDLVKQILAFSRKGEQERMPIQIGPVVKEALKLLRSSLPTTIEIRQDIKSDTGIVEADPTQIHQIVMNLCANASHAMREKGGILEVGISNVEVGSWDSESGYLDMTPGNYLRLTVSDTGQGMTPEVLERLFEPYFTTKEKGEGTGLGLSVVHGIVKNYGGTITAYSEPGKGTTFHVYLPVIQGEAEVSGIDEVAPIPTGNEHILFIDDEPALVEIGKQILERLGYKVTTRTSSMEALELFKAKPDQFDLVITDMTMPHMTGERLAGEIINIRSDIPVVICTGYSVRISEEKAKDMGIKAFVMKPFVIRDLAKTVREVLEG